MSDNTVYLITGANRGIGLHLTALLLARPNTTVIATSRTTTAANATATATAQPGALASAVAATGVAVHPTSRLIPFPLDEADPAADHASLAARLAAQHPELGGRLDVVVANAGGASGFKDVLGTEPEEMARDFDVNALGPARLFRAVAGLLLPPPPPEQSSGDGSGGSSRKEKKFVLVSSSVGSIGAQGAESLPGVGYGMSKAAANWWAKKVSVEFKDRGLIVGVLHPGWVKTAMGQAMADAVGFPEPPLTVEESAKATLEQIDGLTPEKSGQFLAYNGMTLPW